MSKLFGMFGKKKKNKDQRSTNLLNENTAVTSELPESAQQNTVPTFIFHDVDYSESDNSENCSQLRVLHTTKKQGLDKVNSLNKSPSDRISYTNRNEKKSLNIYGVGFGNTSHTLNRSEGAQFKASNKTSGLQNLENISDDRSIIQLKTSEIENFISDTKVKCVGVQTDAPTRNPFMLRTHDIKITIPNEPVGYGAIRKNNVQRRSKNLSECVNNVPYRVNEPVETITNDGWVSNETGPNKLSLKYGEQSGRAVRQGRVSVLIPLELDGQDAGPRSATRGPMAGLVSEAQPRSLSIVKPVTQVEGLNKTGPNRLSLRHGEQTGRSVSQGRVSVLIPLELDGQDTGPRSATGGPMAGLVSEVQPRKLSVAKPATQVEEGLRYSVLNPEVMKPVRLSVLNPVTGTEPNKYARYSTLNPIMINQNAQSGRVSVSRPSSENKSFPLSTPQAVVYAVRRGTNEPENQQSLFLKRLFTRKRDGEQTVSNVATVPTRGRTGSILQQSVKSLTSQRDEHPISRKNIRYSVDTDVFSADVRRRNPTPIAPGYVNMERGQGMLVSELLNPITTIFVSDLKDPVPKDPDTKPREANIWVRPRRYSMREVVTPNPPQKHSGRVQISVAPVAAPTKMQSKSKQIQQNSRYESSDESSSTDSDESNESIDEQPRYPRNRPTRHRIYAASMPIVHFPDLIHEVDYTSLPINGNKDLAAGTTLVQPSKNTQERRQSKLVQPPNVRRISAVEQTAIEDAVDFLCNPPEDIEKTPT